MALNEKQQHALNQVALGHNIYISGSGGKGKSYTIHSIVDKFQDSTVLLAPTGIAALNIGGSTIHSAFKFPTQMMTKKNWSRTNAKAEELFAKDGPVKRIVLDEVSMVRGDLFTTMDQQLRRIRRSNVPFGGLQIVCVGDFYQLPPVLTNQEKNSYFELYESAFAFGGESWSAAQFEHIELVENMRQSDETFRAHLEMIRVKGPKYKESVEFFNNIGSQNLSKVAENDPIYLCSVNRLADEINNSHYDELGGEEHVFYAKKSGEFKAQPAPYELRLKYGTKVIFTCNHQTDFKNGEIGYFLGVVGDKLHIVKESDESEVYVEVNKWEDRDYEVVGGDLSTSVKGTFKQYPIKHAWAVSIHKSQGLTLDNAVIDMTRPCFASGQLYVALSRLRSLDGLGIIGEIENSSVIVDPEVQEFYANDCRGIGLL